MLSYAVIVYHNDWGSTPQATRTVLQNRGYVVYLTDRATDGLNYLQSLSTSLNQGDRMVVYLAGHGSNPRTFGDTAKNLALNHFIEFNDGTLSVSQIAPIFEALGNRGINLTVIDGSCNGGETVYNAIGQKYCAVSTVSVCGPSLTGWPSPADSMLKDPDKSTFGLWWDDPHLAASWMNGNIVSQRPERFSQRLYRNDSGEFAGLSLFIRPAVHSLQSIGGGAGWFLWACHCRLYTTIYAREYANLGSQDRNAYASSPLVDAESFIAIVHSWVDPQIRFITTLQEYLNNQDLMTAAANVFEAWHERAWQTLSNDPVWDLSADPQRHVDSLYGLSPADYKGKTGFLSLVKELKNLTTLMQTAFAKQQDLLRKIDEAITVSPLAVTPAKIPDTNIPRVTIPHPSDPRWSQSYNTFERKAVEELRALEQKFKIRRTDLLQFVGNPTHDMSLDPKSEAWRTIDRSVIVNRGYFTAGTLPHTPLSTLVSEFKAVSADLNWEQGRSSLIMSIIEDAVDKVQRDGPSVNPGDVTHY